MSPCVRLCPPDTPTTSPPSTTPPLHPNPADRSVLSGTGASDPAGDRGTVAPGAPPRALCMSRYLPLSCPSALSLSFWPLNVPLVLLRLRRRSNSTSRVRDPPTPRGFLPSKRSLSCPPPPRGISQTSELLLPEPQSSKCHVGLEMSGRRRRVIIAPDAAAALR